MSSAADLAAARACVEQHFRLYYGICLGEVEIDSVPGYWRAKEAKIHRGHPLHQFLGCSGPFQATYQYRDPWRVGGRFASPYRTWRLLRGDRK